MHNNFLALGFSSFLAATTSAAPLEARGPGPVETWFASSHLDTTCGSGAFQNFSGSSSSCNIIEDTHPPAEFIVRIGSILVGAGFGTYDFTFLPGDACAVTGLNDRIYKVGGGETTCVDVSSLEPGSFYADNVSPSLPVAPRLLPESVWNATFYSGKTCGGSETKTFQGSASSCNLVKGLLQPPRGGQAQSNSALIHSKSGSFGFSFFENEDCEDTALLEQVYEISGGQSLCVTYEDIVSFQVTDEVDGASKRSADASLFHGGHGPVKPIAKRSDSGSFEARH